MPDRHGFASGIQKRMAGELGGTGDESVAVAGEAVMTTVNRRCASRSDRSTSAGVSPRATRNPR